MAARCGSSALILSHHPLRSKIAGMAETWISVTEAAKLSGYHPEHLRELIREGRIKARKVVTVWQIEQASLLAYIRAAEKSGDKRRGAKGQS